MLKDLAGPKKIDKEIIVTAISSLKSKGWDINPYSVADEAKVARSVIFRNTEFMELVSQARGESPVPISETMPSLSDKVEELNQEISQLCSRITELERDNQNLAKSIQDAWQDGYQAGCKESLTINVQNIQPTAKEVEEKAFVEESNELEIVDSFTTKLFEALKVDGAVEASADNIEITNSTTDSIIEEEEEAAVEETTEQIEFTENIAQEVSTEDDDSGEFTEGELRSLLNNRFVRVEEAPVENKEEKANSSPASLHKFVGAHRPAVEPAPVPVRPFPPEIRKACLMLGIRPHEITQQLVLKSWKDEMAKPGVHPDSGGDTEMAIYLNVAKDTLMRWIETQSPKLGKKFGQGARNDGSKPNEKQDS
jgi:prefoldin subunit 5